ncbi:hypothetical protein EVA_12266 [gut metagenome]|uniref:Uncharacterized protein n=1 Tax=gut metagenome TaxID=749906 RepID=J9FXC4_9ZZZZ
MFVMYPFNPSHCASSAIFSSDIETFTSFSIFKNLLYPRLFILSLVIFPEA